MSSPERPGNGTTQFRMNQLEARMDKMEAYRLGEMHLMIQHVTGELSQFKSEVKEDLDDLRKEVKDENTWLRRILISLAISIAVGSLLLAANLAGGGFS